MLYMFTSASSYAHASEYNERENMAWFFNVIYSEHTPLELAHQKSKLVVDSEFLYKVYIGFNIDIKKAR